MGWVLLQRVFRLAGWLSYWAAGLSVLHDPDATSKSGKLK